MMKTPYFLSLETCGEGEQKQLAATLDNLTFNASGLIPVVTQDQRTGKVLMLAWMNREAIEKSLASGDMTYWSRSRQAYWRKGESSGHVQRLKGMWADCDGDALLCLVEQTGPPCHTGRSTCFYLHMDHDQSTVTVTESPTRY
jgi:phosphoribosyl-AMP cyclohydrolase